LCGGINKLRGGGREMRRRCAVCRVGADVMVEYVRQGGSQCQKDDNESVMGWWKMEWWKKRDWMEEEG
jgi:hypothetical protein